MKKSMVLLCALLCLCPCLAACRVQPAPEPSDSHTAGNANITTAPPKTSYAAWGMPEPFEHYGGDDDATFVYPYSIHRYNTDVGLDYRDYLGVTTEEEDEFYDLLNDKGITFEYWGICEATSLLETGNLFSLIIACDIPNEAVLDALQGHNDMCDRFAEEFNDEGFRSRKYTEAEIDALLSRDLATATQLFATEYAIVIDNSIYAPGWLYIHDPEDYEREGITPEMIEQKIDLFDDLYLTDEAAAAFKEKLLDFIGAESIPTSIVFTQSSSCQAQIPKYGSRTLFVTAQAMDKNGNAIPDANPTYSISPSYSGVTINSSTGEVTIQSTAAAGTVNICASYDTLTDVNISLILVE